VIGAGPTLAAFVSRWLKDVAQPKLRPATFERYEELLRLHVIPHLGHIRIGRLTPADVQAVLNGASQRGLKARTVSHIRAVIRTSLNQALRWGIVSRNVAALATPPRIVHVPVQVLTPDQALVLLEAVAGSPIETLVRVALSLGLRQGEALGLRWQDVDFAARQLHVRHALQRVAGELTLVEPKSRSSRRTLPLPEALVAALREHKDRQPGLPAAYLFTTAGGQPLDGTNVTKTFQKLLRAAGLPRMRFHDLRHSCASLLLAQGVSPRQVMETLGHSQISLTMNTYSHILPNRETADVMDRVLGSGPAI
jgi:integrase